MTLHQPHLIAVEEIWAFVVGTRPPQRWVYEDGVARVVHQPIRHRIPVTWAFSRLLVNPVRLEAEQGLVSGMVDQLRAR